MFHGNVVTIPLGQRGLRSDDPQTALSVADLILANDVLCRNGMIEKAPGSAAYNFYPLGDGAGNVKGISAFFDFWPTDSAQRIICLTTDGKTRRLIDPYNSSEITGTSPAALTSVNQAHFMSCGIESINRSRKLLLFNGRDNVQVISGDATTRSSIRLPALDWSGTNQPSFGILHKGRVIAFGNANNPHGIYISSASDHEDFQSLTDAAQYPVYPGEGERLFTAFEYKGRIFLGKYPRGVYYIDDSNPNVFEWAIIKVTDSYGMASVHAAASVLDDLLAANATGSITSLNATQAFGDVKSGDVLTNLHAEQFMRTYMSPSGTLDRWALYDADKKLVYFTYRSAGGSQNDRLMVLDVSAGEPKVVWFTKDQPNCLGLIKDAFNVLRPAYGAADGFLYLLDRPDRAIFNSTLLTPGSTGISSATSQFTGYLSEFQTPHMDFSEGDTARAESVKIFKDLELVYVPTGRWPLFVDVFIDGLFVETISFKVAAGPVLGDFSLNRDRLGAGVPRSIKKPLHGKGRRISFRCYNSGERHNFKACALRVYFKYAGQQQSSQTGGAEGSGRP